MPDIELPIEGTEGADTFTITDEDKESPFLTEEDRILFASRRAISETVRGKYYFARDDKESTKSIWLKGLNAWRGIHDNAQASRIAQAKERNPESDDTFVKITDVKVRAAFGQILEVLFPDKTFPIEVKATPEPKGIDKYTTIYPEDGVTPEEAKAQQGLESRIDPIGFVGDGNELTPGDTAKSRLSGLTDKYLGFLTGKKLSSEPSTDKNSFIQLSPAEEAAAHMTSVIQDQLMENNAESVVSDMIFEMVLYGTGIIKGPFTVREVDSKFTQDIATGEVEEEEVVSLFPTIKHVTVWDAYPEPSSKCNKDMEWMIERHRLTASQLRALKRQSDLFDKEAIDYVLAHITPQADSEDFEHQLQDNNAEILNSRYEVLEYWGPIDAELARAVGLDPNTTEGLDEIQVNIWVAENELIKISVNPFPKQHIPYYFVPYQRHPHQLWGIGIAEQLDKTQFNINSHTRLAIDNLRLSGNVMWEVDQRYLIPGQEMATFPSKIWHKNGGPPGQSVFAFTVPNVAPAHFQAVDKLMQFADIQTLPSFSHGQTGVSGVGRTASGISMLLQAAALQIKTVIKNLDNFLLKPLGEQLFRWNMRFNEENVRIRGDLRIVPLGSKSLLQKEVMTQRLLSLIQVASNPLMAPHLNANEVFKEIAKNMNLEPEKFVNDFNMATMYAQLIQAQGGIDGNNGQGGGPEAQATGGNPGGPGGTQPAVGGINPADTTGTGGGNIGFSAAPASSPTGPLQ